MSETRPQDHAGAGVLDSAECFDLLRGETLGRVGFVRAGTVEVLPVNFVLTGSAVAFRTGSGSKLGAALDTAPVTFEVDGVRVLDAGRAAWSVVVKGVAGLVTDPEQLARLDADPVRPSLPSAAAAGRWVLIRAEEITGRLVPLTPAP